MDLEPLKIDREPRSVRSSGSAASAGRRPGTLARSARPILLLALLLGLGWVFRAPLRRGVDRLTLTEIAVLTVRASNPLAASAVSGVAANGYVVASKRAALSADTPGRVVELNVQEGDLVRKGDIVARLYSAEYEASLRQREAELLAAERGVERAAAEQASSTVNLETLRTRVTAAAARGVEAEARLEIAEIKFERAGKLVADGLATQEALDDARTTCTAQRASFDALAAELDSARAARAQGEAQLDVSRASLLEAEARVEVAAAARDGARATLEKTKVRAPFDGIVILKDAEVGEVVSPNAQGGQSRGSVATLVDFASLEVQVEMPETGIASIRVGAPANIYLDAYPEQLYTGRIERIWPTANRQKATVEVRIGFDQPDEHLRPEMGARVVFSSEEAPAGDGELGAPDIPADLVLVPTECVVRINGQSGVFVLERDVVHWRPVTTGGERAGRVAVTDGLEGGERIAANPPPQLADGDRVRIQEQR